MATPCITVTLHAYICADDVGMMATGRVLAARILQATYGPPQTYGPPYGGSARNRTMASGVLVIFICIFSFFFLELFVSSTVRGKAATCLN